MDEAEEKKGSNKFRKVADKLNVPKKVSQFEKARQEAEQKRQREEAEAAAALREFEDSLDVDDDHAGRSPPGRPRPGPPGFGRPNLRHHQDSDSDEDFAAVVRGRGAAGTKNLGKNISDGLRGDRAHRDRDTHDGPPSLKRRREQGGSRDRSPGRHPSGPRDVRSLSGGTEGEPISRSSRARTPEEPAVRRPTMLLQQIPENMTEDDVRGIIPANIKVEEVVFLSSSIPQPDERLNSALVITSAATPVSDINTAVSTLQGSYLGFGSYLNISRHVSAGTTLTAPDASVLSMPLATKRPFGATTVIRDEGLSFEAGPTSYNRVAPPSNLEGVAQYMHRDPSLQIVVTPPSDLKLLKLIHLTFERLVTYGPHFEALLMSRPKVQRDEKWAWLFDPTSKAGVYFRWLIYQYYSSSRPHASPQRVFDAGIPWTPPQQLPRFPTAMDIEDLTKEDDYVSSSDDDDDADARPQPAAKGGKILTMEEVGGDAGVYDGTPRYLNPYRRAKLTYLLARLPDNNALLRVGDVARVSDFVIRNAGQGAEECVDMLISNLEGPFCYRVRYGDEPASRVEEDSEGDRKDRSGGQLVALYVISDVLLASATSGVRDAWKYRALFEEAILERRVFERLGRLERDYSWGRMKAEQWKRRIMVILELWYSANVFTTDTQKVLKQRFLEPPLTAEEQLVKDEEDRKEREEAEKRKWKTAVDAEAKAEPDVGDPATAIGGGAGEAKSEAMKKIAAIKAKFATPDAAAPKQSESPQAPAVASGSRRSRPTAADLNEAGDQPEPVPEPEPPKVSGLGFGFSLSSSAAPTAGAAAAAAAAAASAASEGKARTSGGELVDDVQSDKRATAGAVPKRVVNMFADSDEE